jgi:dihydrofolate reductase
MSLKIIAAMSNNWVIGSEGTIPWTCPEDRRYFDRVIEGHDLIVGRKTYETCQHLPRLIVLSTKLRVKDLRREDTRIARTVDEVMCSCSPDTYVIGGEQIYRMFLPLAQWLFLSQIDVSVAGDTFFPNFGRREWEMQNNWRQGTCRFFVYQKVRNALL